MTALLQVSGIECGYGSGKVLDGVSMTMERGEIVALIGRNGVGKTTLMRALIGLVPLSVGSMLVDGIELGRERPYARAKQGVGYVSQGREVFPALTVRENFQVGAQANRSRTDMLDKVVGYFPALRAKFQQKAGTMSGGEQQ